MRVKTWDLKIPNIQNESSIPIPLHDARMRKIINKAKSDNHREIPCAVVSLIDPTV